MININKSEYVYYIHIHIYDRWNVNMVAKLTYWSG